MIERKYLDMFERLKTEAPKRTMEPLPGWLERRRRHVPAAKDVVANLPVGPAGGELRGDARRQA